VLRGRLSDFGLFDVLQLASTRTGALRLEGEETTIELALDAGRVVGATEVDRPEAGRLATRLRALGWVDEATLGRALAVSARVGTRLREVLAVDPVVSGERLAEVTAWHQTDLLLSPFTWDDGLYAFEPEYSVVTDPLAEPIPLERLIPMGFEMHDAWPMIRRWVPSWRLVVEQRRSRLGSAPSGGAGADSALEARAWQVAEPGRTAGSIADRIPAPRLHGRWALANLVGRGELEWAPLSLA